LAPRGRPGRGGREESRHRTVAEQGVLLQGGRKGWLTGRNVPSPTSLAGSVLPHTGAAIGGAWRGEARTVDMTSPPNGPQNRPNGPHKRGNLHRVWSEPAGYIYTS
jgi:hypothetical protein